MGKEVWGFQENVIVFLNEELIGGQEEFLKWALDNHGYRDLRSAVKNSFQISWMHFTVAVSFIEAANYQVSMLLHVLKRPKRSDFY